MASKKKTSTARALALALPPIDDEEARLRSDIVAAPEARAPREALAAYFTKRGDSRGEAIALALRASTLDPHSEEGVAARNAFEEFDVAHEAEWLSRVVVNGLAGPPMFSGGLVNTVVARAADLPLLAPLTAREPVQSIIITEVIDDADDADGGRAYAARGLERVRALIFHPSAKPPVPAIAALPASSWAALERLDFNACRHLRDSDLTALANIALPPTTKVLVLANTKIKGALGLLKGAPWLAHLEELNVHECGLNAQSIAELARFAMPRLKKLSINSNPLKKQSVAALSAAAWWSHLEVINLEHCALDDDAVRTLVAPLARCTRIDLGYCNYGDDGARALIDSKLSRECVVIVGSRTMFDDRPVISDDTVRALKERFPRLKLTSSRLS